MKSKVTMTEKLILGEGNGLWEAVERLVPVLRQMAEDEPHGSSLRLLKVGMRDDVLTVVAVTERKSE